METRLLNAKEVYASMDRGKLRKAMAFAFQAMAHEHAKNFPRHAVEIDSGRVMGFMPAVHAKSIGYKAVSVFSGNKNSRLNPHQGIVVLTDPGTGEVRAILEGSALTAIRTAAVSALATEVLSRANSKILTLIGTGQQAYEHALAIAEVRKLERIYICGRSAESSLRLKEKLAPLLDVEFEIELNIQRALQNADILVTATPSRNALLDIKDVRPGTHINAIGACRPGQHEIALHTVANLKIYLDSKEACLLEASELIDPLTHGKLNEKLIIGQLGEFLSEKVEGRTTDSDITFFKSVGLGIEDVTAAESILNRAQHLGLGTTINFSGAT